MNLRELYAREGHGKKNYKSKYFNQRVTVNKNCFGAVESYWLYKDGMMVYDDDDSLQSQIHIEYNDEIPKVTPCPFDVLIKDFDEEDIKYWNQFGIDKDTAKRFGIECIKELTIHSLHSDCIVSHSYMYRMTINSGALVKIYSPYDKDMKWISHGSTKELCLSNMTNSSHKTCCVCSGMKDALSLYCQMDKKIDVLFLNSETALLTNDNDAWLKNRYENIYVCYDNDETGLKQGKKIADRYGYNNIVIPPTAFIFDVKDIADFYVSNHAESIKFFKSKIQVK
jgi:hypothetical protein